MLEPGDINVDDIEHDSRPSTGQEPSDSLRDHPKFLGRYDDETLLNVGDTYEDDIRVKGERNMTIQFQEKDLSENDVWRNLKRINFEKGVGEFKLRFEVKYKHRAGWHIFKYTAYYRNYEDGIPLYRKLYINQGTCSGCSIL